MYGIYDKYEYLEHFYFFVMSYRLELVIQLLRFELSGKCLHIYIYIERERERVQ